MHRVAVFGEALCRHTANSRSPVFREYLAVVMVVLLSWAADAEAAKCMEITSTGRSHELLFHRGGCVTAHPQLMDSSSPAHPLPSPGLAQKPNQCQVWGGLIKTQQWGKDWQSREERTCNEKSRGAGACTVLRNRDVFTEGHQRLQGQVLYLCMPPIQGYMVFVAPEQEPVSFSSGFGRSSSSRC